MTEAGAAGIGPGNAPTYDAGPALVADLGGTHARFGWVDAPGQRPQQVLRLPADEHASPEAAAQAYLALLADRLGTGFKPPRQAVFAVAAPVSAAVVHFTNRPWQLSIESARRQLGLSRLQVLNDFEALAHALPHLQEAQLRSHPGAMRSALPARPQSRVCVSVVGPGTGLGVAALIGEQGQWHALPGEGGHSTLAAGDETQAAILALLRAQHGHVSAERLLSGTGLPLLHQARLQASGQALAAPTDSAGLIAQARAGDQAALASVQLFCAWLGSFCGDIALIHGSVQGLFLGGGLIPRLGELFFASAFRERFEAKGRFSAYLAQIPTTLILDSDAALLGCAALLGR